MRTKVIDSEEGWIDVELDDQRIATFDHFLRSNPDILGNGQWDKFGRSAKDATEALAFAVSQLSYVEQKTYERQYAPMKYQQLLGPVIDTSAGEWAETVEYEVTDQVGMGRRMNTQANDMPFADVASARVPMTVVPAGAGYYYTTQEIRASAYLKRPLNTRREEAAIKMFNRHMNKVALQGEAVSNFTGLFNATGVTAATRNSGAVWDAATADTISNDIAFAMTQVTVATKGIDDQLPTKIALPIASYQLLLKPRFTTTGPSILKFLMDTYPGLQIYQVDELSTLGAGGTKRAVFFNPIDENMVFHLPMPIRFMAPQLSLTKIIVPGEYRYAGFNPRRVLSMYYMDTI